MDKPNHLAGESSPYLLQHANNPVDWFPWGDEALRKAAAEDKMILVSIGYSACHWCHVMEHESFEDFEVAELMNRFFVCIKVDREERPDIDQVYMSAVQLMTGRGGWPLNCFTLPDGRPVYGGTYFPRKQWMNVLVNLADSYRNDKPKFIDYANQLTDGIKNYDLIPAVEEFEEFTSEITDESVRRWKTNFDNTHGGPNRAPKFPLPNNYLFLLKYNYLEKNPELDDHIRLTLQKMAFGGIYDQVGGGFSRYSVDGIWKVPHFEKMLYDNGQLVSLYSEGFKHFGDNLFRDIVYQSLQFVKRELTGPEGNYYSALDADSEGDEGKYYTWNKEELQSILADDFDFFADVFNVNEKGFWEHGQYILLRDEADEQLTEKFHMDLFTFRDKVKLLSAKVLKSREERIHPGLDDKTLLSWNAIMTVGFLDAYDAFGEHEWLDSAVRNTKFILEKMTNPGDGLYHNYKNGKPTINAFLEDYAFFIQALIRLYQVTFEIEYLNKAKMLTEYSLEHFVDSEHDLLFFTSDKDPSLITRSKEVQDNVVPASNSQMAINLYYLGHYYELDSWINKSRDMLRNMKSHIVSYGSGYSNWLQLWLYFSAPLRELVICGEGATTLRKEMCSAPLPPGIIIAGAIDHETIALTKGRINPGQTLIYVCHDRQCNYPVSESAAALDLIQTGK